MCQEKVNCCVWVKASEYKEQSKGCIFCKYINAGGEWSRCTLFFDLHKKCLRDYESENVFMYLSDTALENVFLLDESASTPAISNEDIEAIVKKLSNGKGYLSNQINVSSARGIIISILQKINKQ